MHCWRVSAEPKHEISSSKYNKRSIRGTQNFSGKDTEQLFKNLQTPWEALFRLLIPSQFKVLSAFEKVTKSDKKL